MENLNTRILNLLKEHKEGGEKFFNALDLITVQLKCLQIKLIIIFILIL